MYLSFYVFVINAHACIIAVLMMWVVFNQSVSQSVSGGAKGEPAGARAPAVKTCAPAVGWPPIKGFLCASGRVLVTFGRVQYRAGQTFK